MGLVSKHVWKRCLISKHKRKNKLPLALRAWGRDMFPHQKTNTYQFSKHFGKQPIVTFQNQHTYVFSNNHH
jgi:hypothetical protein